MDMKRTVQFVGRSIDFSGKRLFDILSRLKKFGVGRIVYRNTFFNRYEEPCYYTITRVAPDMACPTQSTLNQDRKSVAYGKKIFRGENLGEVKLGGEFKADWKIVLKQHEEDFLKKAREAPLKHKPILPTTSNYPPLLEYMIKKELAKKDPNSPTPMLKLRVRNLG